MSDIFNTIMTSDTNHHKFNQFNLPIGKIFGVKYTKGIYFFLILEGGYNTTLISQATQESWRRLSWFALSTARLLMQYLRIILALTLNYAYVLFYFRSFSQNPMPTKAEISTDENFSTTSDSTRDSSASSSPPSTRIKTASHATSLFSLGHVQLITMINPFRKIVHEGDHGGFQEDGHRHHGGRGGEVEEQVGKDIWPPVLSLLFFVPFAPEGGFFSLSYPISCRFINSSFFSLFFFFLSVSHENACTENANSAETKLHALRWQNDRRVASSNTRFSLPLAILAVTQAELWSGWMCDPSAEDPLEPWPPPPPPPPACVAAACAIKFLPFSTFSMKFLPMARTDGFLLCLGDGLSTASDTPVMEDMLALEDWSIRTRFRLSFS